MTRAIIGRKIGMMHKFGEKGEAIPITVVKAGPCFVIQKKTEEKDNYSAIQIGFEDKKESRVNKPLKAHFDKSKVSPKKFLREIRLDKDEADKYKEGDSITIESFEGCSFIDVTSYSKGCGFTGVIKRHNFHLPKATHGTHEKFRHGGSLGCRFPQRVVKGKKMAGHSGNAKTTVQNLKVDSIRKEEDLIFIKGAIPGPTNSIVMVKEALKKPSS